MAGDSRLTTENFLRLNFTPKAGITAGTEDTLCMDCDQIVARYKVIVSGVTTTGRRLPSQNQLAADHYVGDSYGGGIVAYVLVSGDTGYVSGQCHGIIAATGDLATAPWGCQGTHLPGTNEGTIGQGYNETLSIIAGCSTAGIAARNCRAYTGGSYSDWFLPSFNELKKLYINRVAIGNFTSNYYWSSTEWNTSGYVYAFAISFYNGAEGTIQKSTYDSVRPVRYF